MPSPTAGEGNGTGVTSTGSCRWRVSSYFNAGRAGCGWSVVVRRRSWSTGGFVGCTIWGIELGGGRPVLAGAAPGVSFSVASSCDGVIANVAASTSQPTKRPQPTFAQKSALGSFSQPQLLHVGTAAGPGQPMPRHTISRVPGTGPAVDADADT